MFSQRIHKASQCLARNTRIRGSAPRSRTCVARRAYATTTPEQPAQASRRLSPLFTGLLFIGIGSTAYGLWELYSFSTIWPTELRKDLRDAVKAKQNSDFELSSRFFFRAWSAAKSLPIDVFKDEPYLKLTGIAAALGDALEQNHQTDQAYEVYEEALQILKDAQDLTGEERLRAVAIASKIGELAEEIKKPQEQEEKALTYAVEEVLKLVKEANEGQLDPQAESSKDTQVSLAELALPEWVSKADVGAPLENLAGYYKRIGNFDYAMPLYLQAISILIPPPPKESPPEDQCRGAQLMGNLTELIIRRPGKLTPERLNQAESWAKQALMVIQKVRKEHEMVPICEFAYAAALFNIGMMRELSGDKDMAKRFYTKGMDHSKAIGMQDGVQLAEQSLQRLAGNAA